MHIGTSQGDVDEVTVIAECGCSFTEIYNALSSLKRNFICFHSDEYLLFGFQHKLQET
jgi:hypothetical protein